MVAHAAFHDHVTRFKVEEGDIVEGECPCQDDRSRLK